MTPCTIILHVGVGSLRFGMNQDEVRERLGTAGKVRPPQGSLGTVREHFPDHSLFVDYDRTGKCAGIEFYPEARVVLDGRDLMAMTYRELVLHLRAKGASVAEEGDGFRCDPLGLAGYAPQLGDPVLTDAPLESVLVYGPGYYDELDALLAKQALR